MKHGLYNISPCVAPHHPLPRFRHSYHVSHLVTSRDKVKTKKDQSPILPDTVRVILPRTSLCSIALYKKDVC